MASNPQQEPTMEEILASIRKIISEDTPEAAPAGAVHAQADVLELTQEIDEAPPLVSPEPVHVAAAAKVENETVFHPIEEAAVSNEARADVPAHEGIFSDKTRKALEDSFARIEPARERDSAPVRSAAPMAPLEGRTVEAVFETAVRETFDPVMHQWLGSNSDAIVERMKPMIREWMDEHFPALLEGAVRDEVARVARGRR